MIEFRDVSKLYRSPLGRTVRAVEGFSLRVAPGEVLGLAGPNGAGKSTLIALLLGYLRPTGGVVSIDGQPPRRYVERRGVGYLSELVAIPPRWTLDGALTRYGLLAGIPRGELAREVARAIERLGLAEHRGKRVRQLSKGTLQRLGLAQALLGDAEVLVLDEPTHGLDPVWTQRFRELVAELRRPSRLMLVASHNLDELERIADRVAIIDRGRLQRVVELRRPAETAAVLRYRLEVASGSDALPTLAPAAHSLGDGSFEVDVTDLAALNDLLARLIAAGVMLSGVAPAHASLERHFRAAIGEASQ